MAARLGLPTPKAQRVRSLDELFAAAADVGFPAVVKPEFGASAMGCVRVDDFESLAGVYKLVRAVVTPEQDGIFRAGSDLLLEQYLDGVEFDVDLILQDGECVFSSVSQNWPTAEPSFQETGLHLPPDHNKRAVHELVDLSVRTVQSFGFRRGVLHVEGKCTSHGPRVIEVNAFAAHGGTGAFAGNRQTANVPGTTENFSELCIAPDDRTGGSPRAPARGQPPDTASPGRGPMWCLMMSPCAMKIVSSPMFVARSPTRSRFFETPMISRQAVMSPGFSAM